MEHLAGHPMHAAVALTEFLFLLLPLPLILIANWADRPPAVEGAAGVPWFARGAAGLGSAIWILLATMAAGVILLALFTLALALPASRGGGASGVATYSVVLLVTGAVAGALVAEPVRAGLARVLPIEPRSAVHATALVLSVVLVGSQLASQLSIDLLKQQASTGAPLGPADVISGEVPFLIAAALGVGLFIRRDPRATLERLGFVRPTGWQLVIALSAAGAFYAFGNGVDALAHHLTPATADKVQAANQRLFGQLGDPVGIATIAL
ncbi:MAG TPA: hypothetical protein VGO86_10410, partial [Candidatus Dormibacteraeota bacterium]